MITDYEFQFDRPGIYRFRRWMGFELGLLAVGPLFAFFGLISGMPDANNGIVYHSLRSFIIRLLEGVCIGYAIGVAATMLFIYLTVGRTARRYANEFKVKVTGPYLNVIEHGWAFSDRKIHFNQLMDYSVFQNMSMRRAGIYAIRITLNSIGKNNVRNEILLPGVINALEVRDVLIGMDTEREKLG